MIVVGIDTCGAEGSLALARTTSAVTELLEQISLTGRRYAGSLVPALRELLRLNGTALASLGALVVVHGPGSFTGIRMGVSLAKALGEGGAIPLIALSRLDVLRRTYSVDGAVLDAGRGEFYVGDEAGECLLTHQEALERRSLEGRVVACEPTVVTALPYAELVAEPRAYDAILLAGQRLASKAFDETATLDGNYLRRPEYRSATQ